MRLDCPLGVVTPSLDGEVLAVLARSDSHFTVGDLHRIIPDRSPEGIRRTLARLNQEGVVTAQRSGRTYAYTLNRQHLAAPAIHMLATLKNTLLERISAALAEWAHPPLYAALFGSAAQGNMRTDSDIDLLLVRATATDEDTFGAQAAQLATEITLWTGNDARPFIVGESNIMTSEPIYADIAAHGVTLAGETDWLRRRILRPK